MSSSIGYMNDSLWLAYSDVNSIHLFCISLVEKLNGSNPEVNIEKTKSLPLACIKPAVCMSFVDQTNRLCYITNKSYLMSLKLTGHDEFELECCIQCIQGQLKVQVCSIWSSVQQHTSLFLQIQLWRIIEWFPCAARVTMWRRRTPIPMWPCGIWWHSRVSAFCHAMTDSARPCVLIQSMKIYSLYIQIET